MEKFAGTWKCETVENFDAYLKEVGMGWAQRKVASSLKPTLTITVDGNHMAIVMEAAIMTKKLEFDLDTEFEEKTPDGRQCKSVVTKVSDTHLHQEEKSTVNSTIDRCLEDDNSLTITCEANGVKGVRKFVRE